MKKENIINIALVIIAVAVTLGILMQLTNGEKQQERQDPLVIILDSFKQEISNKVEALGTAKANESIEITSTATETIKEINFEDGQKVRKGDVIAILDRDAEMAQLSAAKERLKEEQRELKRLESLLKSKAVSRREFDERKTSLQVTKEEINQIQAEINERTLIAPFDGEVGVRRLSVGALVQPGEVITTLDDISQIKLDFTVPAVNLSKLKVGLPVYAETEALKDMVYRGRIQSVNTRVDPVTRSVLVRAIISNEDGAIKPGLLMKVTLLENQRMALMVPEESILQRQDYHFLFIVDDNNIVEKRKVEIGIRQPGLVEITSGLLEGEDIIVRGINSVRDGQKVRIKDTWERIKDSQFE